MIYETKTLHVIIDKNGNDKAVSQTFIVKDAVSFGEAEEQTYEYCNDKNEVDVVAVKRSKLREVLNTRHDDAESVFIADIADVQINDNGEPVEIIYRVAFYALNLEDAYMKLKKHLEQGYQMQPVGVRKTKIVDAI